MFLLEQSNAPQTYTQYTHKHLCMFLGNTLGQEPIHTINLLLISMLIINILAVY